MPSGCETHLFEFYLFSFYSSVGKSVFQNVMHNAPAGKSRILVTHALHFLPQVDFIYTIVDGRIAERGTYTELLANKGEFAKLVKEFGSQDDAEEEKEKSAIDSSVEEKGPAKMTAAAGPGMMQAEERNTGAISIEVYRVYLRAAKGYIIIPFLLLALVLMQATSVMSSYW